MKIRKDFVTNSSSSSFIMGKKGDETTKDVIFNIVKEFYNDFYALRDKLKAVASDYGVKYNEVEHCFEYIEKGNSNDVWKRHREIEKRLEKDFGITVYDYFYGDEGWLECDTYADYVEYWANIFNDDTKDRAYNHGPFFIVDYENDTDYIDVTYKMSVNSIAGDYTADGLVGWYYGCADKLLDGEEFTVEDKEWTCNYCNFKNDKKKCKKVQELVKSGKVHKGNATLELLGKFCIHSECGYIPDYVVNRLSEISSYSCNHMG